MQRDNSSFPSARSRRLRKNSQMRKLVSENRLDVSDLIWPIFVCECKNIKEPVLDKIDELIKPFAKKELNDLSNFLKQLKSNKLLDPLLNLQDKDL